VNQQKNVPGSSDVVSLAVLGILPTQKMNAGYLRC
jgi:hypothetical protein